MSSKCQSSSCYRLFRGSISYLCYLSIPKNVINNEKIVYTFVLNTVDQFQWSAKHNLVGWKLSLPHHSGRISVLCIPESILLFQSCDGTFWATTLWVSSSSAYLDGLIHGLSNFFQMFVFVMKLAVQYYIHAVKMSLNNVKSLQIPEFGLRLEGTTAASGHSVAQ